jgi:transcriptional regulator with XRE-family HTH domain
MTPEDFARWRSLMGLNRTQAAQALGISRNMPAKYEAGTATIPLHVALACSALVRGLAPWPD